MLKWLLPDLREDEKVQNKNRSKTAVVQAAEVTQPLGQALHRQGMRLLYQGLVSISKALGSQGGKKKGGHHDRKRIKRLRTIIKTVAYSIALVYDPPGAWVPGSPPSPAAGPGSSCIPFVACHVCLYQGCLLGPGPPSASRLRESPPSWVARCYHHSVERETGLGWDSPVWNSKH